MEPWIDMRGQFRLADGVTYLNHAAVSPLPLPCKAGMERYIEELSRYGASHYSESSFPVLAKARELGASLMGCRPERVFVVRCTTQGLGIAATGLPLGQGDNVVLVEREFPANVRPWLPLRRRGVEIRFVPQRQGRVVLDDLVAAVDARTAVVSLSFVQFLSGFRADVGAVAEICRRHDALFVLDAIQGLGVLPLDVERDGVDWLAADAHKWLLGPEGVGLGYASPRALERIQPALEGWFSVPKPFDFFDLEQPLKETASRFEEGAYNFAGIHGMVGSLELLLSFGPRALEVRLLELTDYLAEALTARGWRVLSPREKPREKSGILLATRPGVDLSALQKRLSGEGVVVSLRDGALRVSPHAYNSHADLDRLLQMIGD